nr:MAG TPA: hypothetical protein [Caudoviricetes sp.]
MCSIGCSSFNGVSKGNGLIMSSAILTSLPSL